MGAGHGFGAGMVHPRAFLAFVVCTRGVDGVKVGVIMDVDVDWIDADDWAVLLVKLFDLSTGIGIYVEIRHSRIRTRKQGLISSTKVRGVV
jgi:hypothetical protein